MKIDIKKFGIILVSRPAGKEAWLAFQPTLNEINSNEKIIVDFEGVVVLTPSWADEFLTPLKQKFREVDLINTNNPSVKATLAIL
ncbi:DUF4325 domain-containing protein [Candidatus Roizmanbacteria bacterium CG_4_8_14_3_um_filter_34_9]|uniref:DUF4325 domain-containing protein n=3 Tax=Candidatus Roizmaniibacteriota TaxID=1752723 RepID=A0A2M7AVE6_9BACT|nr:MAG: DUF4325 domain-containing protein [Candidatus Roizmanbacteria bacterium CG07_land_8_20_14_0_80_34_15]PIU74614.1 MAG: DUF4325 domain-containing protein [Candidatus Roizmanbacteria bacterium CG06_land_8_20_14_3_00_34_14]PIW73702.1 MAG: DUF4325 domain-containing protein [Candidatus Roizmanbacteria bacterium CG_4_8_14_3_um_filter_34_9]